jgi:hypothetical protein
MLFYSESYPFFKDSFLAAAFVDCGIRQPDIKGFFAWSHWIMVVVR